MDITHLKLGKHLGVVEDPRTIMAAQVTSDQVNVPARHVVAGQLTQVPMFANDRFGDCTLASQAHRVISQERSASQREVQVTDADVLAAYSAVTGFDPNRPGTDNGAYEVDVLNYMRRHGLGRERDGTAHTIGAFVKVDHTDHQQVMRAHYAFGGLKVCAGLPRSAQDQVGGTWDVTEGPDSKFGSWGGHSMYSPSYGRDGVTVWTWGARQAMTWDWWDRYVDEVYAVITEDYMRRGGTTPQGFDADKLARLLRAL